MYPEFMISTILGYSTTTHLFNINKLLVKIDSIADLDTLLFICCCKHFCFDSQLLQIIHGARVACCYDTKEAKLGMRLFPQCAPFPNGCKECKKHRLILPNAFLSFFKVLNDFNGMRHPTFLAAFIQYLFYLT